MATQAPSPQAKGPLQRDDVAQFKVNLLLAYYETSRQELISRVSQRDSAVLLFLAAATAIFGVAFGNVTRPAILFAIAPLGLGAAVIYAQHNTLIGQIGYYSGVEVAEHAENIFKPHIFNPDTFKPDTWPNSWETSKSLTDPALSTVKYRRLLLGLKDRWDRYWGIPKIYRHRLFAIFLLILIPGFAGAVIGASMIGERWAVYCAVVDAAIALRAGVFLIDSALHRSVLRIKVAESGDKTGEETVRTDTAGGEAKTKADSPHRVR